MDSKQILAENIRQNIYDAHKTQRQYALEIGIPLTTLEYVVSAKGSISLNTLDRIAKGAGLDAWELIKSNQKESRRSIGKDYRR